MTRRRSGTQAASRPIGQLLALALLPALLLAARPDPALAKACGGAVACECGDTVVESTTLTADLGICDKSALRITSAVVLDCAGHTITGNDESNAKFGIEIDGAVGAVVRNCRVTKFRRGIRIYGGSDNVLRGNESFENKYGIDLAGATTRNLLKSNTVLDSRDEGIHVGESPRNRIINNLLQNSKRENLYLLRSNGNLVKNNLIKRSNASGIYIKHSSRNRFIHNRVEDTAIQLRGGSKRNSFESNYLKGNGYLLEAYEEPEGWTFPSENVMTDDCIRKTDFCYRFIGAFDNVATAARTDGRCAPPDGLLMTLEELGGQEATGNVVELAEHGCNVDPF